MKEFTRVVEFFYFQLSIRSRRKLIGIFFVVAIIGLLLAISPFALSKIVESIQGLVSIKSIEIWDVTTYVLLYIICLSVPKILTSYSLYTQSELRIEVVNDVSISFFERLSKMPAKHFASRNMGYLAQQLNQINNEFYTLVRGVFTDMISPVIQIIIGTVILLIYKNYLIVLAFFLYGAIFFYITHKNSIKLSQQKIYLMEAGRRSYSTLVDSIQNISAARQYSSIDLLNTRYSKILAEDMRVQKKYWKIVLKQMMVNNLLFIIMFGGCFTITVFQAVYGDLPISQVVLIGAYIMSLSAPLEGLGTVSSEIKQSISTLAHYIDEGDFKKISAKVLNIDTPVLSIKNLSFQYDEQKNSPDINIQDLQFPTGKIIAITGPSGAGKTTLLKLLTGDLLNYSGGIYLNNIPLSEIDGSQLNSYIGSVSQEPYIFQDTLRFNLLIANPKATDNELIRALEKAGMGEFFSLQPNGLDSLLGDRGTTLSGGQRQRISLARLFLSTPKILILDESTAALDFENEAKVLNNIIEGFRGATIVLVSHRGSVLKFADHVVVIENGQLSASGLQQDVQKTCDYYRRLVESQ